LNQELSSRVHGYQFHPNVVSERGVDVRLFRGRKIKDFVRLNVGGNVAKLRKSGVAYVGYFPSLKMKRQVTYASGIERDLCYLLEFDPTVISYIEQSPRIEFNGRRYTPDYHAIYADGACIFECKPKKNLEKENVKQQIALGMRWAEENGASFVLITDEQIRQGKKLNNVKKLLHYARISVPEDISRSAVQYIRSNPNCQIYDLRLHLATHGYTNCELAYVFNMIFYHVISTDIDETSISDKSILTLPDRFEANNNGTV
jgi:hypothetical protein